MNIRRLTEADAEKVHAFLARLFAEDPETGGVNVPTVDKLAMLAGEKNIDIWVAIENGKPVGILAGQGWTERSFEEFGVGKVEVNYFNLLAIDHRIYAASRVRAAEIARDLSRQAYTDLKASKGMKEYFYVRGPKNSRGAHWCRLMGMEEHSTGKRSAEWLMHWNKLWDAAQEAVDKVAAGG